MDAPYRPAKQTKTFKDASGRVREWVRYEGQSKWYRGVANAQIAHAFGRDTYKPEGA